MTQRNTKSAPLVEDGETTGVDSGFDSRRFHQSDRGIIRDSVRKHPAGTESAQKVPRAPRTTYADRPSFEAPRNPPRRERTHWFACRGCSRWFSAPVKETNRGRSVFCSIPCTAAHAKLTGKFAGDRNPSWKGGVSTDNMRYRNRAKAKWPLHEAARAAVHAAVRRGELVRQPCPCGNVKSQAHHHDYSKPLEVEWMCRACHDAEHAEIGRGDTMRKPTP